jgi:hypothetical protein
MPVSFEAFSLFMAARGYQRRINALQQVEHQSRVTSGRDQRCRAKLYPESQTGQLILG